MDRCAFLVQMNTDNAEAWRQGSLSSIPMLQKLLNQTPPSEIDWIVFSEVSHSAQH